MLFCSVLMCTVAFAQKDYSSEQRSLRDKVMSFLKTEGFQPSIDEDGDIKFKRQGDVYYVIISDSDSNPMYLRLIKQFDFSGGITKSNIDNYAREVNKYKMCKLIVNENSFTICMEMYLTSASAFTSIFYKVIGVMDGAEEEFND